MNKLKSILAAVVSAAVMLTLFPKTAIAEEDLLLISSPEELKAFAEDVNGGNAYEGKTVKLDANIYPESWTPIGTSEAPFKGTFDGGYHVVAGLNITGDNAGLFGYVDQGVIKNIVVEGEVNGNSAAGVVGYLNAGTVENCANRATVSGGSAVGGVVGNASGAFTIDGCFNEGNITGTTGYVGGVVGQAFGSGNVKNCYNLGNITGPATVGGVGGGHKGGSANFENCFNIGTVTDSAGNNNNIGAVVGKTRGEVKGCQFFAVSGVNNYNYTEAKTPADFDLERLGNAFTNGAEHPVLSWESKISAEEFVKPKYAEKTELSAELSEYIKAAANSAKANAGLSASDKLFSSEGYLQGASSTATDWLVLALGRYGYYNDNGDYVYLIDEGYDEYLSAMKSYIENTYAQNGGILHRVKATEWHRAVVTIAALGGGPTDFGVYNEAPIDLIADGSYNNSDPGKQGINGWIWGLIALDAGLYDVPADAKFTREQFITEILSRQLTDGVNGNEYGGWVLAGYGANSDVDITAMAIQALAPYYNDETVYTYTNGNSKKEVSKTVREAVDEALEVLSAKMDENGTFSSWGTNNVEGVSQVLVALCSLGIDPAKDERFMTDSQKTILDGVLKFRLSDGGFCHDIGGGWNSMANDQATYALVSYWRFESGMRALYDMRDDFTESDRAAIERAVETINAVPAPTDKNYKASLKAALAEFRAVEESERRYVSNYSALAKAIELVGGEDALDSDEAYIISISVSKAPDKVNYLEGEIFDPAGMTVVAVYSDGTEKPIDDYKITPSGELALGDSEVYITYGNLKAKIDITVSEKFPWSGEGTENSPYLIESADDLSALADRVNGKKSTEGMYFALTGNIDLSNIENWKPIGASSSSNFNGIFDGRGFAIDNLYSTQGGLFGYVGNGAVIKNVGVASGEINCKSSFVGGIVGWSNGADIINCWNGLDITASGYSGGIVGTVRDGESVISGCYNVGNLTSTGSTVGGIVGHLAANVEVTVENCYNAGSVSGKNNVGGIAGQIQDGHAVKNCYNIGKIISDSESAGGIIGYATRKNEVTDAYFEKGSASAGIGYNGDETVIIAVEKTADEMQSDELLNLLGEAFKKDGYGLVNGGYPILIWQNTEQADEINAAAEKIAAIGEVTLDSEQAIAEARAAYDALDDDLKALVRNYALLEEAEKKLAELKKPAESEPGESEPSESEPSESEPSESEPSESEPTESEPSESEPTESEPGAPSEEQPDTGATAALPLFIAAISLAAVAAAGKRKNVK